jgi:predicted Zn finger-like uncharacterized protein
MSCPHCNAEYDLPESLIGAGRKVRCAVCRNPWMAALPEPEVTMAPDSGLARHTGSETARIAGEFTGFAGEGGIGGMWSAPAAGTDAAYLGLTAARPPSRTGAALAWLATFAVLAAAALSAWRWQAALIAAWPPSQRLFDQVALLLAR